MYRSTAPCLDPQKLLFFNLLDGYYAGRPALVSTPTSIEGEGIKKAGRGLLRVCGHPSRGGPEELGRAGLNRDRPPGFAHRARRAVPGHDLDGEPFGPDRRVGLGELPRLLQRAGPVERQPAQRGAGCSMTGPLVTTWPEARSRA